MFDPMKRLEIKLVRMRPFFATLPSKTMNGLLRHALLETVPAKTVLLREGRVPDSLYVLIDGLIQLFTICDGHEITLFILRPVTCFVAAEVLNKGVLLMSARTIQPSHVVRISANDVRRFFRKDRDFARAIVNDFALTYQNATRELKNMRARTSFERLVAWILAMQAQSKTPSKLKIPYNHTLLAARLGMAPESLSRNLARLTKLGVTVRGRTLRIASTKKLRQVATIDKPSMPVVP